MMRASKSEIADSRACDVAALECSILERMSVIEEQCFADDQAAGEYHG